jgi:hypothetical protein
VRTLVAIPVSVLETRSHIKSASQMIMLATVDRLVFRLIADVASIIPEACRSLASG